MMPEEQRTRASHVSNSFSPRERISATARKLHKNPELMQTAFQASAQWLSIVALQISDGHQMPIPTRLANDGWWLCERHPTTLAHSFSLQKGSAMADFTAPASHAGSVQEHAFPLKPAIAFALAALADWLFYGHRIGISAVIFAAAVACGSLLVNFANVSRKPTLLAGVLLLTALVPAIEEFNAASLAFLALALCVGLLLTTNRERHRLGERAAALCNLYLVGPFRFFRDAIGAFNLPALTTGFAVWFIPVLLGSICVSLGQRDVTRRYQLCVLCPSRRLSPHPHGTPCGWLRSGRHEARRPRRTIEGDPAAGVSMGGAECPAGGVLNTAPRSLRADLSPDLVARRGLYLDVAGHGWAPAHRRPHRAEPVERLADRRQPHHPGGHALYLLADELRRPH